MRLPHHFTGQFGNPMDAAQESGTWGDEGKAVERRGALTALLFVWLYPLRTNVRSNRWRLAINGCWCERNANNK